MNVKLKRQLRKRKQRTRQRIDPGNWSGQSPMIDPPLIKYELAQRQQAISAGGIGTILQVIKRVKLREAIQRRVFTCPEIPRSLTWHELSEFSTSFSASSITHF